MLFENEFEYLVYFKSDFECVLGRLNVLQFCLLSLCQLLENPSSSLHLLKSKRAAIQDSRHWCIVGNVATYQWYLNSIEIMVMTV